MNPMSFLLAANTFNILSSLLCIGVFGLLIALALRAAAKEAKLEAELKAGTEIPLGEVPQHVRDAATRLAPKLQFSKAIVKYRKDNTVRKYELHGHVDESPIQVEVMPQDAPPLIREIEVIYRPYDGRLSGVEVADIPVDVMQAAHKHMDALGCPVKQIDRAKAGTILDQNAYELKGDWKNGRVEIKVLASGEVIKVELKFRDRAVS